MTNGELGLRVVHGSSMTLVPARASGYPGDPVAICAIGERTQWSAATRFEVTTVDADVPAAAAWAVGSPTAAAWAFVLGQQSGTLTLSDGVASATLEVTVKL